VPFKRRPPPPLDLSDTSFAVEEAPSQKNSTTIFCSGNNSAHVAFSISFCPGSQRVEGTTFSLKQQRCPRCGQNETLNRHSLLHGNDPGKTTGQSARGQRVFCSNRGQRGGCGGTFSIFLAEVLPRHTVTATLLWKLLSQLLSEAGIKAAAESLRLPFALETLYHLLHSLRQRSDRLRPWLCRRGKAPDSSQTDPLLQTVEHLQCVFTHSLCPVSEFQFAFQQPLLG
jgi:hypothetical protein